MRLYPTQRTFRHGYGLLALVLLSSCSGDSSPAKSNPAAQNSIKIGMLTTLTGGLSREGQSFRAAAEMAMAEINEAGGVLNRPIELVIGDTGTDPDQAVTAAQRLSDEGVIGFVGPIISSASLSVTSQVAQPQNLPVISPSATSPELSSLDDGGLLWRTAVSDAFKGKVVARYAYESGNRTAALLFIENSFGRGLASEFTTSFTELGGTVLNQVGVPELSADQIATYDFRPEVEQVMADQPDLVYVITFTEEGIKIAIAADGLITDTYTPRFISEISPNDSVLSLIGNYEWVYGVEQQAQSSANRTAFIENYQDRYDSDPVQFADATYDALYLMALAIEQAGSTAAADITANLQAISKEGTAVNVGEFGKARSLIADGGDIDYEGASGSIDFDSRGDVSSGTFRVWQISNGSFVDVETITVP